MDANYLTLGRDRGYMIATWCDYPEIGDKIDNFIDYVGLGPVVTADNQMAYYEMICLASEVESRSFSPFDFTAEEINEKLEAEDAWEQFEIGISDGVSTYMLERIQQRA